MIVTIGDSVCWGQGLRDEHKFDRIYAAGRDLNRIAHSGAVLGARSDTSTEVEYPEVPAGYPSVWQQVAAVEDWTDVDVVLVNGGINDVSLTRILNPGVRPEQIEQLTQQFCGQGMADLLAAIAGKLLKPGARIAVLGYYPILSPQTKFDDDKQAQMLMEMHGVATSSTVVGTRSGVEALIPKIVDNCMAFWKASDTSLAGAVDAANGQVGRPVCVFVQTPFTEVNALWAPETQLWQLSALLEAEDEPEIKELRDRACEAKYGDVADLIPWAVCDRASVGHPDVTGAARYAAALTAALG